MEDKFKNIKSYIDDVMSDKTNNTLGDWISDYGGVVNENYTITFGSHFALQKMLDRRDKEVIRIALSHAINSHDELVAEVERLRQALIDAATSLETIHVRSYGEDSFLDSKQEMRSYAGSRAKIARAALSEQ